MSKEEILNVIYQGDCLEVMKGIEDGGIDLILTDPPYGTMEGAQLDGWENNKTSWDVAIEPKDIFFQCERLLRENGILILFSQEPYTSKLITEQHNNLPFLYRMIWKKDHFANALIAKKAPVNYFEDILVFSKKYDTLELNPLRKYAEELFKFIGKTKKELFNEMGNQGVCHFMRIESMQFGICTEKTYNELIERYKIDKENWFKTYSEILEINNKQEKIFNLLNNSKFKSNILEYKKDYEGLHPTQKPVKLIGNLIETYSHINNTVLDFTAGSGTTGVACKNTNRNFILIEKDENYCKIASERTGAEIIKQ